jgi:hypothetical protein
VHVYLKCKCFFPFSQALDAFYYIQELHARFVRPVMSSI